MEYWNGGTMKEWNCGMVGLFSIIIAVCHCSNIPFFKCSSC
jgi:hypothetical protein